MSELKESICEEETEFPEREGKKRLSRPTTPLRIGCEVNPLSTTLSPDE
jgi:hypothetical protein